jgi:hypothetical protein
METQESPEPRSVPGSLFLLRSSLLIDSPALFTFALIHEVRGRKVNSAKFMRLREVPVDGAQDLLSMTNGISIRLKRHRRVAAFDGHYKLKEVAVADHNVVQPTTVDLASLAGQR